MARLNLAPALRIFLAGTLISFGLFPFAPSFADETPIVISNAPLSEPGGDGTNANPYRISTCEQLNDMNFDIEQRMLENNAWEIPRSSYILLNDIDCSDSINWNDGKGFTPIQYLEGGYFDGRGHTIINLYINDTDSSGTLTESNSGTGFIRKTSNGAQIRNVNFEGGSVTRNYENFPADIWYSTAGSVVGDATDTSFISVNSSVDVTSNGGVVGGIVGILSYYTSVNYVTESSYTGNVTGTTNTTSMANNVVGGIAGTGSNVVFRNTFVNTTITATSSYTYCGGLAGFIEGTGSNNYSAGEINCSENTSVFGIATNDSFSTMTGAAESGTFGDAEDYFSNTTQPPLNQWDFESTWETTDELPILQSSQPTTPDAPENLTIQRSADGTSYNLDWDEPLVDGDRPITGYKYRYTKTLTSRPSIHDDWYEFSDSIDEPTTSVTVTGLDPDATYVFQVAAVNDRGIGQYTYTKPVQKIFPTLYYESDPGNYNSFLTVSGTNLIPDITAANDTNRTFYLLLQRPGNIYQSDMFAVADHIKFNFSFPDHIINNVEVITTPMPSFESSPIGILNDRNLSTYTQGTIDENNEFDGLVINGRPLLIKIDTTYTGSTASVACVGIESMSLWGEERQSHPLASTTCVGIAPETGYELSSDFNKTSPILDGDTFNVPVTMTDSINYPSFFNEEDLEYFSQFPIAGFGPPTVNGYFHIVIVPPEVTFNKIDDDHFTCMENYQIAGMVKQLLDTYQSSGGYKAYQCMSLEGGLPNPVDEPLVLPLNLTANEDLVIGETSVYTSSASYTDTSSFVAFWMTLQTGHGINDTSHRLFERSIYTLVDPESTTTTTAPVTSTSPESTTTSTTPEVTTTTTPEVTTTVPDETIPTETFAPVSSVPSIQEVGRPAGVAGETAKKNRTFTPKALGEQAEKVDVRSGVSKGFSLSPSIWLPLFILLAATAYMSYEARRRYKKLHENAAAVHGEGFFDFIKRG